jgi:RNA polymerase sigma-70 factor (ECF subfamily)
MSGGWSQSGSDSERRDQELVSEFLRRREEGVFRALYRRHSPMLYHLVLRLVGGRNGDAEEVIQVVWLRAIEKLSGFRWESSLRSWLTGIAVNFSREFIRQRSRVNQAEPAELEAVPAPPKISRDVSGIDLERAIAQLPDGYREVLVLHDVEGYTHIEIGRFLGIEEGTSKSQLSRARRAIRALLGGIEKQTDERRLYPRTVI